MIDNNSFEYVDLGLPSGTLWAKCNVGATSESDYGLYFAWGETVGYPDESGEKKFKWTDYKWWDGADSSNEIHATKYNGTDGKTVLDLEDDAARVNMGGSWRMPTEAEFNELTANTTSTWETVNGVNGMKFTNKSDSSKYIFIPAAGYCCHGSRYDVGSVGFVCSSSLYSPVRKSACQLFFTSSYMGVNDDELRYGQSVRGVLVENKPKNHSTPEEIKKKISHILDMAESLKQELKELEQLQN